MVVEKLDIQTRAYLRAVPGLPVVRQREMAADAKCHAVYEYRELGKKTDARDAWLRSLRPGDTAWLPSLICLVVPPDDRHKRFAVSADLAGVIASALARGASIVDARARISSADGKRWADHVSSAVRKASQGERSKSKISASLRKANAARGPGIVTRWLAPAMDKERKRWAPTWRDPLHTSDEAAHAALPAELRIPSPMTARRIFGVRRPNDKRAGGRPRKPK